MILFAYDYLGKPASGTPTACAIPDGFALHANDSDPFNSGMQVVFDLPHPAPVKLSIFDVTGRPVAAVVEGVRAAGRYRVLWDAGTLPAGMYLARLHAGARAAVRKTLLL